MLYSRFDEIVARIVTILIISCITKIDVLITYYKLSTDVFVNGYFLTRFYYLPLMFAPFKIISS